MPKPPPANVDSAGDGGATATEGGATVDASFLDASGDGGGDPYFDCEPLEAGDGHCPCTWALSRGLSFTMPCGTTICEDLTRTTAHCTTDGHLIVVADSFAPPYCTGDVDGGADAASPLRVCDAGTQPTPPR